MRARTLTALSIAAVFSLACLCGGGSDRDETGEEDTSWDDWDWDKEDTATEDIPVMTSAGAYCTVGWGSGDWEAEPGYWQGNKDFGTSKIQCTDRTGEQIFTVEVDGILENDRVRFPITSVDYGQGVVSDWVFRYVTTGGEADWITDGRSSNGEYLWGHMEGELELTDEVSGETLILESLEIKSWPRF